MPSSVIKSFSYDKQDRVLRIIFVSGRVYEYKEVPESVYQHLKEAGSKGSYFNQEIRDKFHFEERT